MANYEIDSFLRKFKALCQAGRSASLNLSSNAGKVSVNLRVDLGVLHEGPHHPPTHSRNGPARQRRREKRAVARVADAEEAEAALSVEEREVLEIGGQAVSKSHFQQDIVPEEGSIEVKKVKDDNPVEIEASATEVIDEVCNDSEYESRSTDDDPNAKPISVEVPANHPKPPPVRDRSLGGIDYYTATYDDPTDDEDEEIY